MVLEAFNLIALICGLMWPIMANTTVPSLRLHLIIRFRVRRKGMAAPCGVCQSTKKRRAIAQTDNRPVDRKIIPAVRVAIKMAICFIELIRPPTFISKPLVIVSECNENVLACNCHLMRLICRYKNRGRRNPTTLPHRLVRRSGRGRASQA
jgi:hypothetical protein